MAAFWQRKAAEELEFPADCISFEEDDLPGVTPSPHHCQANGAETFISSQQGSKETKCLQKSDSARAKIGQLETISCTGPTMLSQQESAALNCGGEKCSGNGAVFEQHQNVGSPQSPGRTRMNGIGGSEDDVSDDVLTPGRRERESLESASTSEEHRGLRFFGEAATRRPAYKYLVDLDHGLENGRVVLDSQPSDSQSSGMGSSALPEERALQSPNGVPRTHVVSVKRTEMILQNGVHSRGLSRSEESLGKWQGGKEDGDIILEGRWKLPDEIVSSPFWEESTATAEASSGASTFVVDNLCPTFPESSAVREDGQKERMYHAEGSIGEEALGSSSKPTRAIDPTAVQAERETSMSVAHPNEPPDSPQIPSQTERCALDGASVPEAGGDTSALEEYLARSEGCEEALEECESTPAADAAAALREAVRRMREDAATLALRLSEVYISDASDLRRTTQSVAQHVGAMQSEAQEVRSSLVAYMSQRGSFRSLLTHALLSAVVFVVASEAPRLSGFVVRWLGNGRFPGTRLSWIQKERSGLIRSLSSYLPKERWPLRWRLIIALGVFRVLRLLESVRQERARRVAAKALLDRWNQIAERVILLKAIAEGGSGTSESVPEATETHV